MREEDFYGSEKQCIARKDHAVQKALPLLNRKNPNLKNLCGFAIRWQENLRALAL
ncbi:MAG: hypothetical protein JXQ27_10505 [Acidobacteria bacterium]|nr:hypothetical protein [Acidobacteriota bacterium]